MINKTHREQWFHIIFYCETFDRRTTTNSSSRSSSDTGRRSIVRTSTSVRKFEVFFFTSNNNVYSSALLFFLPDKTKFCTFGRRMICCINQWRLNCLHTPLHGQQSTDEQIFNTFICWETIWSRVNDRLLMERRKKYWRTKFLTLISNFITYQNQFTRHTSKTETIIFKFIRWSFDLQ